MPERHKVADVSEFADDGSRVIVDISPEGIIHYVFREVDAQPAAKGRVEAAEAEGVEAEDGGEAEGERDDKNAG